MRKEDTSDSNNERCAPRFRATPTTHTTRTHETRDETATPATQIKQSRDAQERRLRPDEIPRTHAQKHTPRASTHSKNLSGEYSPEYHLTGVHSDISRFHFKFGQPVICSRLIATRQRDGFRFSPYGQLGFYVGSAGLHGDSLIHFPENKIAVYHIRPEVQAIQLYRQDIKTNALTESTVSYYNQDQLLFPNPVHMPAILPQLIGNSTPAGLLLFDTVENIQAEISCTDRHSR